MATLIASNVAGLCPTLAVSGLAQFRTPRHADNDAYKHDIDWFARHRSPRRRWSVREMVGDEFEPPQFVMPPPRLWVTTAEVSSGFHHVYPVWRGNAFFRTSTCRYILAADVGTDAEIAAIIDECFRRVGVDHGALARWEADKLKAQERPQFTPRANTWERPP